MKDAVNGSEKGVATIGQSHTFRRRASFEIQAPKQAFTLLNVSRPWSLMYCDKCGHVCSVIFGFDSRDNRDLTKAHLQKPQNCIRGIRFEVYTDVFCCFLRLCLCL